jgi:hypothetical protein
MKRIIHGVTYNTATATRLAESRWTTHNDATGSDDQVLGTLYQTQGGAFFVHAEITEQAWDQSEEAYRPSVVHEFDPLSPERAHKWFLEGDVEVFHNPFGDDPPEAVAEAEPGATIYVRVPSSLKQRVEEAARAENLSGNVWAMRCLERCVAHQQSHMAADPYQQPRKPSSAFMDSVSQPAPQQPSQRKK